MPEPGVACSLELLGNARGPHELQEFSVAVEAGEWVSQLQFVRNQRAPPPGTRKFTHGLEFCESFDAEPLQDVL